MKNTGEIRRIDDLGRIVVPRHIRKAAGIFEGDPFEVLYDDDGVYFKKYNQSASLIERTNRLIFEVTHEEGINDDTRRKVITALREVENTLRGNAPKP